MPSIAYADYKFWEMYTAISTFDLHFKLQFKPFLKYHNLRISNVFLKEHFYCRKRADLVDLAT